MRPLPIALIAGAALAAPVIGQSADVEVNDFGVGNYYRPGEFTGIRITLIGSTLSEATPVWVQVEVPNADGDVVEYGRPLTLSPSQQLPTWLYVPLPPDYVGNPLSVRIFEERDGRRRGELGGGRISPTAAGASQADITMSMIAVVAPSSVRMALDDYTNTDPVPGRPRFAHEDTRIVSGLTPSSLPDQWEGLKGFEAVVWAQSSPRDLREAQVRALREYIRRGGHLVICLPDAGNPWSLGALGQSPFEDLLALEEPPREEDVPLEDVISVLSKTRPEFLDKDVPFDVTIHVFRRLGDGADLGNHYEPLIALDDGRVVAVQRSYGFGRITVVGVDLASGQLLSYPGAIQADVLWNRILGRRMDTPSRQELFLIEQADRLSRMPVSVNPLGGGQLVAQLISMSETAGRGLGAAFLLFVIYWVVAGPGAFFVLKQYRLEKHSWVVFAAAAGVFTASAWGLVSLIKPSDFKVKHLTFLDMISHPADRGDADPAYQRAVSYMTLYMSGYRRTAVFLESTPGQRDLLASWSPPGVPTTPFPNPDRWRVDVGNDPADLENYLTRNEGLADYRMPTRATATNLYAHWMGGLDADWGGIIRVDPNNRIRAGRDLAGNETLQGGIVHDLPVELEDVTFIWVKSKRTAALRYSMSGEDQEPWVPHIRSGQMLNTGQVSRRGRWARGTPLDLATDAFASAGLSLESELEKVYVADYVKRTLGLPGGPSIGSADQRNYLEMLLLFNQLEPPKYLTAMAGGRVEDTVAFQRRLGRESDLSGWFTRPCLIVIGHLDGADLPIPLRTDGEAPAVDEDSRVVVRWIYPLPLDEQAAWPGFFEAEKEKKDKETEKKREERNETEPDS